MRIDIFDEIPIAKPLATLMTRAVGTAPLEHLQNAHSVLSNATMHARLLATTMNTDAMLFSRPFETYWRQSGLIISAALILYYLSHMIYDWHDRFAPQYADPDASNAKPWSFWGVVSIRVGIVVLAVVTIVLSAEAIDLHILQTFGMAAALTWGFGIPSLLIAATAFEGISRKIKFTSEENDVKNMSLGPRHFPLHVFILFVELEVMLRWYGSGEDGQIDARAHGQFVWCAVAPVVVIFRSSVRNIFPRSAVSNETRENNSYSHADVFALAESVLIIATLVWAMAEVFQYGSSEHWTSSFMLMMDNYPLWYLCAWTCVHFVTTVYAAIARMCGNQRAIHYTAFNHAARFE